VSYTMHRVFCATPGDLEAERKAFHDAIGEVNESQGISREVLLVPVSIVPNMANKTMFQPMVEANLRSCAYFVLVLHDTWGSPRHNFEAEYNLACQLKADASALMRGIALFFKSANGRQVEPKIQELRSLAAGQQDFSVCDFESIEEYKQQLRAQLAEWLRSCG